MKTITKHFAGILLALMAGAAQGAWAQITVMTEVALYETIRVSQSQTVKLGYDYTLSKGRLDFDNVTITLDLNGHTLTRPMTAADAGGQVIAVMNGGQLTITDSSADKSGTITGGWAYQGGAIYVYEGCELTIEGGTITGNRADQISGGGYGFGGGVENHGTMTITGGNITGNTAGQFGGGIHNEGKLTITGGTFTGNTAGTYGGAIYSNNTLNIINMSSGVTLSDNTAQSGGGAICTEGETTLHHVTLTGNNGGAYGGGIYLFGNGSVLLQSDCTITGNTAQTGGGIFVTADGASLKMRDKPVVEDNTNDDVYLSRNQVITLAGSLSPGASVGVFTEVQQDNFTTGYRTTMNTADPSTFFHAVNRHRACSIGWNADNTEGKLTLTGYKYIERAWDATAKKVTEEEKSCTSYTAISGNDTSDETGWLGLYDGWYVVTGNASRKVLNVQGNDVNLIIPDGTSLTVTGGVKVELKANAVLNIYGQAGGMGQLIATNSYAGGAGIGSGGGSDDGNAGQINIHGGTVTATGNEYGAGIGGGDSHGFGLQSNNSGLTVYGGTVTAQGGEYAAGIGSGDQPGSDLAGYVTIYGGTVRATGGKEGAGIGGGNEGHGAMFSIYGGTLTATGGRLGAGIGGGDAGRGGQLTFYGGTVNATGGLSGAAIGGGEGSHGGLIEIFGGDITAQTDPNNNSRSDGAAAIGGGMKGNSGTIRIKGGTVNATGYGSAGIDSGFNAKEVHLTIEGGTVNASCKSGAGIGGSGDQTWGSSGFGGADWNVITMDVLISGGTVTATCSGQGAGIGTYTDNHLEGKIEITGGTVIAKSYNGGGAAIGTGAGYSDERIDLRGEIIISGGDVTAEAGYIPITSSDMFTGGGAAIGGGMHSLITETGKITITGGTVKAISAQGSAIGLGGTECSTDGFGTSKNNGTITITGGTLDLTAGTQQDLVLENARYSFPAIGLVWKSNDIPEGKLIIGDQLMVTSGGAKVTAANRAAALANNANQTAHIEVCNHEDADLTIIDGTIHQENGCNHCLVADGTIVAHTFGDDGRCVCGLYDLKDDADNNAVISALSGQKHTVMLSGRTLYKDGAWNTLCLPFALGDSDPDDGLTFTGTPLEGATVKTITSTAFDSQTGELTLNFSGNQTKIVAGGPYIVKWDKPANYVPYDGTNAATSSDVVNPVFRDVDFFSDEIYTSVWTEMLTFRGIFSPFAISGEDRSLLYLGADNTLYYPNAAMTIGAFRAYFELADGLTAGDPASGIRTFVLNFDGEETGIREINASTPSNLSNPWFSLDGRRLSGKPAHGGLYLHNGRKVLIK